MLKLHYSWLWIVFVICKVWFWCFFNVICIAWYIGVLIATVKWQFCYWLLFVIYAITDYGLEFVAHVTIIFDIVVETYYFLLWPYLTNTILITISIIVIVPILILWMILPHQLFKRLEYPLTRCLLLKPQHILFILVHQPKTQPTLILQILLTHLQQSYPKLVIICLLIRFLLYVQKGRIATYVTFRP